MSLKDVKRALSTILQSASNLQSLSILDLNAFLFPPKELKAILDSLPRLRELEMSGIQKKYEGILVDVLPRLRTLGLDFLGESGACVFLKSRQSDSLQEVVLYNAVFNKDTSLSFPTVHTLRVCPTRLPSDIDALTYIFPDVRDLVLVLPRNYGHLDPQYRKNLRRHHFGVASQPWSDAYEKSWRDRLLARPTRKADAWPHIQSLRIAGVGEDKLGWLGLTCHVPRVEVCSWRVEHTQLAGMLKEQRPRCLVFHPGTFHGPSVWIRRRRTYGWNLLCALQLAPSITRVAIVLCKEAMDLVSKYPDWLVRQLPLRNSFTCAVEVTAMALSLCRRLLASIQVWRSLPCPPSCSDSTLIVVSAKPFPTGLRHGGQPCRTRSLRCGSSFSKLRIGCI